MNAHRQDYSVEYYRAVAEQNQKARDAAVRLARKTSDWNAYLIGATVALFLTLLYVCVHYQPVIAAPCMSSGVMQLDPTTIRARQTEVIEI